MAGRQCSLYVKNQFGLNFQQFMRQFILEETKNTLQRNGLFANFEASRTDLAVTNCNENALGAGWEVLPLLEKRKRFDYTHARYFTE